MTEHPIYDAVAADQPVTPAPDTTPVWSDNAAEATETTVAPEHPATLRFVESAPVIVVDDGGEVGVPLDDAPAEDDSDGDEESTGNDEGIAA